MPTEWSTTWYPKKIRILKIQLGFPFKKSINFLPFLRHFQLLPSPGFVEKTPHLEEPSHSGISIWILRRRKSVIWGFRCNLHLTMASKSWNVYWVCMCIVASRLFGKVFSCNFWVYFSLPRKLEVTLHVEDIEARLLGWVTVQPLFEFVVW